MPEGGGEPFSGPRRWRHRQRVLEAGLRPAVGQPAYSMAKHAAIGLTRQAALEFVKDNIRVNAVAPGVIQTPLVQSLPEDTRARLKSRQPSGRLGEVAEVANTIV